MFNLQTLKNITDASVLKRAKELVDRHWNPFLLVGMTNEKKTLVKPFLLGCHVMVEMLVMLRCIDSASKPEGTALTLQKKKLETRVASFCRENDLTIGDSILDILNEMVEGETERELKKMLTSLTRDVVERGFAGLAAISSAKAVKAAARAAKAAKAAKEEQALQSIYSGLGCFALYVPDFHN